MRLSPQVTQAYVGQYLKEEIAAEAAVRWTFFLRGLWASGLRLTESLELYWDQEDKLHPVLTGKYPMLRIPADLEKGNKERLLPMAPEFAELLTSVPEADRTGPSASVGPPD